MTAADQIVRSAKKALAIGGRPHMSRGSKDAPNLSPSVIARLRGEWEADHTRWQRRDLSARRYVYVWADGVYLQARMEPQAETYLRVEFGLSTAPPEHRSHYP